MIKKLAVTSVLILFMSIAVAGCASTSTYPYQPLDHDALLENFVAADRNFTERNVTINSWETTWVKETTVNVEATGTLKANNTTTVHSNRTLVRFSSIDNATKYLSTLNLAGFEPSKTNNSSAKVYELMTGNPPTVFTSYRSTSQSAGNVTTAEVTQCDEIVITGVTTLTAGNVQTPSSSPTAAPTAAPTANPTERPTPAA